MAVNPASGKVYVANTEARNEVRFEGPGRPSPASTRARPPAREPHHRARAGGGGVTPRHLNKHINYVACCARPRRREREEPRAPARDGGHARRHARSTWRRSARARSASSRPRELENDTFVPSDGRPDPGERRRPDRPRARRGRRPALRADPLRQRDLDRRHRAPSTRSAHVALYNPEPASVVDGRPLPLRRALTSSHGDSACASCHVFGDFDSLAWDLGNPDDIVAHQSRARSRSLRRRADRSARRSSIR